MQPDYEPFLLLQ